MLTTLLIILSIVFALIVITGFFLPSRIAFERNLSIDADIHTVFGLIDNFDKWEIWSAWSTNNDNSIVCTFDGKHAGKGAVMRWKGKKLGAGRMEITDRNSPETVAMELFFNNSGFRIQYVFTLSTDNGTTHVNWKATGKMRRFGVAKIIALMIPRWMGRDMQIGLTLLKQAAEQK